MKDQLGTEIIHPEGLIKKVRSEKSLLESLARGIALATFVGSLTACGGGTITDQTIEEYCNSIYRPAQKTEPVEVGFEITRRTILADGSIRYSGHNIGVYEDRRFKRLTLDSDVDEHHPALSEDKKQLAFVRWGRSVKKVTGGFYRESIQGEGIYAVNIDGSNLRAIALQDDPNTEYNEPTWSEDGAQIAFVERSREAQLREGLIVANSNGSKKEVIIAPNADSLMFNSIRFSPSGRKIAFSNFHKSFIVDIDKRIIEEIFPAPEDSQGDGVLYWLNENHLLTETLYQVRDPYVLIRNYLINLQTQERKEVTAICHPTQPDLDYLDQGR